MSRIQIKGLRQLTEILERLGVVEKEKVLQEAIANGAQVAANAARRIVPVDSGDLADSLHVGGYTKLARYWRRIGAYGDLGLPKGHTKAYSVLVGTKLPYGHLVELGTSHSRPKPFLRPAVDGNVAKINEAINTAIQQICDEA